MPPRKALEAPGTSVSAAATRPPVSDSAVASVWPASASRRITSAASSRAAGPAPPSSMRRSSDIRYLRGLWLPNHPHRTYHVVRARHQRYHESRAHDNLLDQRREAERRGQHVQADRDDLQQGLELASLAGRDDAALDDGEAQRGDAELAEQDQRGDPDRQLPDHRQGDQRRSGER